MNITDIIQMSISPSTFIQYLLDINPLLRTGILFYSHLYLHTQKVYNKHLLVKLIHLFLLEKVPTSFATNSPTSSPSSYCMRRHAHGLCMGLYLLLAYSVYGLLSSLYIWHLTLPPCPQEIFLMVPLVIIQYREEF